MSFNKEKTQKKSPNRLIKHTFRPNSEFKSSLENDILREKVDKIQTEIDTLERKHSSVCRENHRFRSEKYSITLPENWEKPSLSCELEDLYALLSTAHMSINTLKTQEKELISTYSGLKKSLGMLKYQLELSSNTSQVKANLLTEAIQNRASEYSVLHRDLLQVHSECTQIDEEVTELEGNNEKLCLVAQGWEEKTEGSRRELADLYGKLSVVNGLLEKTEERLAACQAFIALHAPVA